MGVESQAGAPEGLRWPRLTAEPRRPLRSLLPRGYAGYTEATTPRHLVLPASTAVPLVVKLVDSPYRPPQFIVARLVRFDAVWRRLGQHKPLDWAGVARDAGYADQAHLIRDFREFTGTTPAELARRLPPRPGRAGRCRGEVNSVQDRTALRSSPRAQWPRRPGDEE